MAVLKPPDKKEERTYEWLTFAATEHLVAKISSFIQDYEIQYSYPDGLVGILGPNSKEWIITLLALNRCGACFVPISTED